MYSVRETAARLGFEDNVSVVHDLLGFWKGVPQQVSLRKHVVAMNGPHFTVNMIMVAPEDFNLLDIERIDQAIADIREIYEQAEVGVNVDIREITGSDADGFRVIAKQSVANKFLRRVRGPGRHNLDVSFVPVLGFAQGLSSELYRNCQKKWRPGQRGAIVGLNFVGAPLMAPDIVANLPMDRMSLTFGHEVGHLFKLKHEDTEDNLMRAPALDFKLTPEQIDQIRFHCAVRDE